MHLSRASLNSTFMGSFKGAIVKQVVQKAITHVTQKPDKHFPTLKPENIQSLFDAIYKESQTAISPE